MKVPLNKFIFICCILLLVTITNAAPGSKLVPGCDSTTCKLPNCLGMGTTPPLGLNANEIPQLVFLTFEDAVADWMLPMYERILAGRRNPNGCPIAMTFYVTHDGGTNYQQVNRYYNQGHEMASHTVTHLNDMNYWATGDVNRWTKEIDQQRDIISKYANIPKSSIQGHRAPYLQTGGDSTFQALNGLSMTYDSSLPTSLMNPPLWPFTLDYGFTPDSWSGATGTYPGLWDIPMVNFQDKYGAQCSMPDSCFTPATAAESYDYFLSNFQRYSANRTPFGVYQHVYWFNGGNVALDGFVQFLDYLGTLDYVYIVTVSKGIEWMKNPSTLAQLKENDIFGCPAIINPAPCPQPQTCNYANSIPGGARTMDSCTACPATFPWLDNTGF